jgi:hypothetical protein
MKFAFPEFLFALLVLILPIIIHLFNFRKYKTLYFSSLQFLKQVTQQTKSTQKLKHILVLITRMLAFTALVFAFAQPYIPNSKSIAPNIKPVQAIYIDNSYSMEARGNSGNLLSEAKEIARKIISDAPLGTSFMLITNELSGLEQQLIAKNEALDRIDYIDFYPSPRELSAPLNTIKEALQREGASYATQYVAVSDFQKNTTQLDDLSADTSAFYYPIQVSAQDYGNVFIDSIWFDQPLRKLNKSNTLNVRIQNLNTTDLSNVELRLAVDDYERQTLFDIPANGSQIAQFNYTDKSAGWKNCKVEVSDNQLYFDDTFYFTYEVKEQSNVIIVNESGSSENPLKVFETDDFFIIKTQLETQLQQQEIIASDVIVLNGLASISSGLITLLKAALDNQTTVFIIPGNDIDLNSYNNALSQLELPIITKKEKQNLRVNIINYKDQFFEGVFDKVPEKINLPSVPLTYSNAETSKSNFVPLLQFENQRNLAVRHGSNKNLFMLYTGLQDEFGALSEHIIFSTLLLRAAELSGSGNSLFVMFGNENSVTAKRPAGFQGALSMKNDETDFIPPAISRGNIDLLNFDKTALGISLTSGNYSVMAGTQQVRQVAINYSRQESNNSVYSGIEINELFQEAGAKNTVMNEVSSISDIEQLSLEKPREYWRILLILALAFLALEMLITTFWKV